MTRISDHIAGRDNNLNLMRMVAAAVGGCFVVGVGVARLTGHWRSAVTTSEYVARMPWIHQIDHVGAAMGGETAPVKQMNTP